MKIVEHLHIILLPLYDKISSMIFDVQFEILSILDKCFFRGEL